MKTRTIRYRTFCQLCKKRIGVVKLVMPEGKRHMERLCEECYKARYPTQQQELFQ